MNHFHTAKVGLFLHACKFIPDFLIEIWRLGRGLTTAWETAVFSVARPGLFSELFSFRILPKILLKLFLFLSGHLFPIFIIAIHNSSHIVIPLA